MGERVSGGRGVRSSRDFVERTSFFEHNTADELFIVWRKYLESLDLFRFVTLFLYGIALPPSLRVFSDESIFLFIA